MRREVTALVPCYNEAPRIGNVLKVLAKSKYIKKIIVVDDGSTDDISKVVKRYKNVNLVKLKVNLGKAHAIRAGLKLIKTPVTLLIDADLIGLNQNHIKKLLSPVLSQKYDASIGILYRGGPITTALKRKFIIVSGQRAIKTKILKKALEDPLAKKYWIELSMNRYFKKHKSKVKILDLIGVDDVVKILKWGPKKFLLYLIFDYNLFYYKELLLSKLKNIIR